MSYYCIDIYEYASHFISIIIQKNSILIQISNTYKNSNTIYLMLINLCVNVAPNHKRLWHAFNFDEYK